MSEHTPGPWANENGSDPSQQRVIRKRNDTGLDSRAIAVIPPPRGAGTAPWYETEANARLIAAAPELLAALRNMLALLGNAPGDRTADERAAYALVARLEGK